MSDAHEKFRQECLGNIGRMQSDEDFARINQQWLEKSIAHRYTYNFSWMGRPIIQYPQDIVAMQEIIWNVQPDLVIETGVAHGGSLILYASLLQLLGGDGHVIGIDIDIRAHNRTAIESHPMAPRITLVEGPSLDPGIVAQVRKLAEGRKRIMVLLDSNHTHDHVREELKLYSPLVSVGSYLVVFDTIVEDTPEALIGDRPWGPGNNPKTAVHEFLSGNDQFVIDRLVHEKLKITVSTEGYLKRIR